MLSTLRIIADFDIYFSLILPIIRIKKMTRNWWFLLQKLSLISCSTSNTKIFLTWYLVFWFCVIFINWVYIKSLGFIYIKLFIFEFFQMYAQHFDVITAIAVLKMLKHCYQYQKKKLIECDNSHKKTLRNFLLLKDCVNYFNQLFGWRILFHHIFGTCRILIYIDDITKKERKIVTPGFNYIILFLSRNIMLVAFWVLYFF